MFQKNRGLKRWRTYLDWILILLILFFAFVAIILVPTFLTASGPDRVPYALHSILNANYGIDPLGLKYFQVKNDIIAQVIEDQNGFVLGDGSGNPISPGAPTEDIMQPSSTPAPPDGAINSTASDIPSPTYAANLTPVVTEQSTPGAEITQQASQTPGSSSKTAIPTHSVATRRPTLTSTTRSPGSTSIAPTRTTTPTTQSPASTTASPTHTSEPTELPTSTLPPPTRTPTPTEPAPTNTPRPTRPPDPYPPPPPPPEDTPYP